MPSYSSLALAVLLHPLPTAIAFQTPLARHVGVDVSGSAPRGGSLSRITDNGFIVTPNLRLRHQQQQQLSPLYAIAKDNKSDNNNDTEEKNTASTSKPSNGSKSSSKKQEVNDDDDEQHTTTSNNPFKQAYHLYVDYFDRLWSDTDVDQRHKLARQRATDAILHVKNMVSSSGVGPGEEYLFKETASDMLLSKNATATSASAAAAAAAATVEDDGQVAVFADLDEDVRRKMEEACDLMLGQLEEGGKSKKKKKNTLPFGKKVVAPIVEVEKKPSSSSQPTSTTTTTSETTATASSSGLPVINDQGDLVSPPAYSSSSSAVSTNETELSKALVDSAKKSNVPTKTAAVAEQTKKTKKKKGGRSVLFGATMGLAVAGWVYSGNYIFTTLFTLMTALGQLEYYRMVMNAGIYPARRISVLGACATFVTALFAPDLHQIVLPVASTWAMIWFLTMRRSVSTISEIATTFTGMFYLGYIPSFWVRIRQLGGDLVQPTRLAPLVQPLFERLGEKNLPAFLPKILNKQTIHFPITAGANFIFWTWLCIAFSDVGGYFAGRRFGKTKLGAISPAAGKTSPNKTVEGVIGGCAFSLVLATLGAWIQKWPYWFVLGPIHGVTLALLGLVGDLTASMLKRDAGLKDFGDLIPEHGGIMDRVDSYIFTAPYGWIMCGYVIPWLKRIADARAAAAILAV